MNDDSNAVEHILRNDAAPTEVLADAFDAYHASPNHWHLAENLRTLPLADDTKAALIRAKLNSAPLAVRAIAAMEQIDKDTLDYIEARPNVLRAYMLAQQRGGR